LRALSVELLKDVKSNKIGRYRKDKVIKLFEQIIKENFADNEEIPSIYIIKDIGGNAFAVNSLLLNFIKRLNSIIISRELFDCLSINELKAIIAHEIGHFKKYISIADRIPFVPFLFSSLIAYILTAVLIPDFSVATFVVYLFCFGIVRTIINWPFKIFKKDVEFLSDLYAANKYGKLHTVNALIKLYQIEDIDIFINLEIAKFIIQNKHLQLKDMQKAKKRIARKLSKKIYDEKFIKTQVVKCLKGMDSSNRRELSKSEIQQRNKALEEYMKTISKLLENKTIDWDDIDNHIKDKRIDSFEYDGMIKTLKNNPELQLFRTPGDNIQKMKLQTHPALRERILFVDKNCLLPDG
jgi:hypothetical protein